MGIFSFHFAETMLSPEHSVQFVDHIVDGLKRSSVSEVTLRPGPRISICPLAIISFGAVLAKVSV